MIHGHGNDGYRYKRDIVADFSSNVWFEGTPDALLSHLQTGLPAISQYPEPDAESLKKKIAEKYNLRFNQCLVTNGSVEAFYLVAFAYSRAGSTIATPCFAEYEDACRIHGHKVDFLDNRQEWENIDFENQLLWIGNPNNPDGNIISLDTIRDMLCNNPETLFVIDEAYGELCAEFQSAVPLIEDFSNILIIRSFTKSFAIPGLRLGYVLGSEKIIKKLEQLKMPWTVNALALEAGLFILDNYDLLMPEIKKVKSASETFQEELKEIGKHITVIPSECNYFLVKLNGSYASQLKEMLMEQYGILIRDASNFRGLDERFIRLAVQRPENNKLLIEALIKVLKVLDNG
ncbi:MAG: pyridoxal phosphate-dependent aminotransferase [Bacteroidales bacterium]